MEPSPGVAAAFAFNYLNAQADLEATVRADGEYAVRVRSHHAVNTAQVLGIRVALWGNPADPAHDAQRCSNIIGTPVEDKSRRCATRRLARPTAPNPFPAQLEKKAFLTLPTSCTPPGVGLETRMRVESWDPASAPADASFISHLPPGYHGEFAARPARPGARPRA